MRPKISLLILIISLLCPGLTFGQIEIEKLDEVVTVTLTANTFLVNGVATIELDTKELDTKELLAEVTNPSAATEKKFSQRSLSFDKGDLIIQYSLNPPGNNGYYLVSVTAIQDKEKIRPFLREISGDYPQIYASSIAGKSELRWKGFLENYFEDGMEIQFILSADLYGIPPFDPCSNQVTFTVKQQKWHYIAAGTGLAAIGIGQIFRAQSEDGYNNDYLTQSTVSDAKPHYKDANNKHHTYLILTYTGAGILIVDAVWYLGRYIKYKNYKKRCPDYEQPKIQLKPSANFARDAENTRIGMTLHYTF